MLLHILSSFIFFPPSWLFVHSTFSFYQLEHKESYIHFSEFVPLFIYFFSLSILLQQKTVWQSTQFGEFFLLTVVVYLALWPSSRDRDGSEPDTGCNRRTVWTSSNIKTMQDFKVKEVEEVEGGKGRGHTDTHTHILNPQVKLRSSPDLSYVVRKWGVKDLTFLSEGGVRLFLVLGIHSCQLGWLGDVCCATWVSNRRPLVLNQSSNLSAIFLLMLKAAAC